MNGTTAIRDVSTSSLCFGTPRREKTGLNVIPMSTTPNSNRFEDRLRFQLGEDQDSMCKCRFGLDRVMEGQDPNTVERRSMDIAPSADAIAKLEEIDTFLQEQAMEHSQEWFKTATLSKAYKPLVRNTTYDSVVSIKLRVRGDKPTPVYVMQPNGDVLEGTSADIVPGISVIAIVDTPYIWWNPSMYGISLTARSLLIKRPFRPTGLQMFNLKPGLREAGKKRPIEEVEVVENEEEEKEEEKEE